MIVKIKDKLAGNRDEIERILDKLNCTNVRYIQNNNRFIFGHDETSTGKANTLYIDTLKYSSFSRSIHGDIITMVADFLQCDLGKAIKWLGDFLGIKADKTQFIKTKLPFNGFWKNLSHNNNQYSTPLTYPMERYLQYDKCISYRWLQDNISIQTQEKYDVRYDVESGRILIPWTYFGKLTGIVGRLNVDKDKIGRRSKYLSLISFVKSKCVFGFDINYKTILENGIAFVFEAEKSCMQLDSMGKELGLGIGSSTISEGQAQLIKSLYVDYVLCFDSDHTLDECITEAKKLKIKNPFFENKVYVLYDKDHEYMKPEDKVSPTDLGEEIFNELLEKCLIEV